MTTRAATLERLQRQTPHVIGHLTEKAWLRQVVDLATILGWSTSEDATGQLGGLIYHPLLSKWSERGWPDLALARRKDARFLLVELKSDKGTVSPRQAEVIDLLRACGLDVRVWRPADIDEVAATLR